MKTILDAAIERGKAMDATYLDIRLEKEVGDGVSAEDGGPKEAGSATEYGLGARALAGGSWGFSASKLGLGKERETSRKVVEEAVRMAKALGGSSKKIELAQIKPVQDRVKGLCKRDPFKVSFEKRMEECVEATKRMMKQSPLVKRASAGVSYVLVEKYFMSSDGTYIQQSQYTTLAGLSAVAVSGGTTEYYSHIEGGNRGYELVREYDMVEHAGEIAEKAVALARAKPTPTGKFQVLLDPEFVALLTHEVVGHPSEADRVIGREAAWAGRAWWADKIGQEVFSDKLTIVSDPTTMGHLGSFKYDDEGSPSKRMVHIEKGVLKELMHSRETAKVFGVEPNGSMRASGYVFAPLIRMTNTYIEKGDWKPDEMLEDMKEGIYLKGEKVPSIDSRRYNFQISAKEAFLVKGGEVMETYRSPTLTGITPEFFSSVDAVGRDLKVFAIPNCGKGEPMQSMRVGNGGPHIRGVCTVTGPK